MSEIPKAIHEEVIELCGVKLRCYQLDNGQRVIEQDDLTALFEVWESPGTLDMTEAETTRLVEFIRGPLV